MTYKESFIKFMVDCGVLTFGEFTLKSGRKAPYFINCGNDKTGGIPLAVSAVVALSNKFGIDVSYCFDRKEVKDHGEGGMFVGKTLTDGEKVVIIDDVMTSGKALRETLPKLRAAADVDIPGMVITVDRMEKGTGELSAVQEAKRDFGVTVYSIVNMEDIINAIENDIVPGKEYLEKMREYRNTYGV